MAAIASQSYRRLLVAWTDAVRRFAWLVVLASVLTSVAAAVYLAGNVRVSTSTTDMLAPDLSFRRLDAAMDKAFPQNTNNLVVVIDAETPDLADDAARALGAGLRDRPEVFGALYDPQGSEFFRKNGFLYLDLDELFDLSDRLAEAQPFLGALWRDPSVVGLGRMLELAADEFLKDPDGAPIEIARVLNAIADVAEAQARGRFRHLSWHELMSGDDADATDRRRVLVVQPVLDFASFRPAAGALESLRSLAREMALAPENGVRVRLAGSAAMAHEELQSVEQGMGLAGALSLTLVIGLLAVGLRSTPLVLATLATLIMGLIWTAAFAILALGTLNLISVAFAVLFIGLSVDFGIHYGLRYREGVDGGRDRSAALRDAADGVGGALTLCAASAAIAFYSFLPTDYLGLAELGLIAGTGMFIAFFANLTVLPALLAVIGGGPAQAAAGAVPGGGGLKRFVRANGRAVCWSALALGAAAALLVPKATFDFDPLNLKDRKTESVAATLDLMADSRNSPYTITILADSLDAADALARKLEPLPPVDGTMTLRDFVPKDQDRKLDVIATMALFLAPSFAAAGTAAAPTPDDRGAALRSLMAKLGALAGMPGGRPETEAARRLGAALDGIAANGADAVEALENRLLSALPGRLDALNAALAAEPVSIETLPDDIVRRQVAADGRARLTVFPTDNLSDRRALTRFVDAVRGVAPDAIGSSVIILEAGRAVVAAFWQAGALSVALITVLLAAILRRPRDVALVFAPLVLAALLTVAASVLFALPFNFANVIVLPLLFGLGVASGIHLVLREREEAGVARAMETSTPRAVVFSALTTIGSFGSIALSSHPGTASMGILLTIAITLTLVCTLVVLPALMTVAGGVAGDGRRRGA